MSPDGGPLQGRVEVRVSVVLQGDAHPGVEHDEDHPREEGVLLRVQAQNHGNGAHVYSCWDFQCSINRTCYLNYDNYIIEDTLETASHFYVKIVYKHNMMR